MAVYAILNTKNPANDWFIYNSLSEGVARFGWSYEDVFDLRKMEQMSEEQMKQYESKGFAMWEVWGKSGWLISVKLGDYFVYINQPEYGQCTVVKITGTYRYASNNEVGDFRHSFDCSLIGIFNRNNRIASGMPYHALRPRMRYQRIYDEKPFFELLHHLESGQEFVTGVTENLIGVQIDTFIRETTPWLLGRIKHYFAQKRLEDFMMEILRYRTRTGEIKDPYVFRGWGTDTGCDIRFGYYNPMISTTERVIMQVKAYEGRADVTPAIQNLTDYLKHSRETAGQAMIVTTADEIDDARYRAAKAEFEKTFRIPIHVLYGKSLLAWIFRYGSEMLLGEEME
jgi:hypothetical protein